MRRRLEDCRGSESRFYLQLIPKPKSEVWFQKTSVGKNSIGKIASKISSQGGLHCKTNHSARKTGIQTLFYENVSPTDVAQISGHRNIQSFISYSYMSDEQLKNISKTLSKKTTSISSLAELSALIPSSPSTISNEIVEEFMSDWELNDNSNQTELPGQVLPAISSLIN